MDSVSSEDYNPTDLLKTQSEDIPLSKNEIELYKRIKKKSVFLDLKLGKTIFLFLLINF